MQVIDLKRNSRVKANVIIDREYGFHMHLADGSELIANVKKMSPYKHCTFFETNALGIPYKEEIHGHLELDEEI